MSSYLLLRNNKETGPFTIEEIRGMSLKSYDLIWVVGKSAAWRYPGEVPELKSFAPALPEEPSNPFIKKQDAERVAPDSVPAKKTESAPVRNRENNFQRSTAHRSVYVNLPSEKKQAVATSAGIFQNTVPALPSETRSDYDFSEINKKQSPGAARISGKILWISTITLLFGAGILTGFFISDRREFFSSEEKHTQQRQPVYPALPNNRKENAEVLLPVSQHNQLSEKSYTKTDPVQPAGLAIKRGIIRPAKKQEKAAAVRRDSVNRILPSLASVKPVDSLRQNTGNNADVLYQKIKTHPENYLNLVSGVYSIGLFGGISSFPVTITNNSTVLMDQVVVSISYIQNNDKIFKTENLSFTDLEPGETVSLKAPKSPRGTKIAIHIHIVNIQKLGLSYSN